MSQKSKTIADPSLYPFYPCLCPNSRPHTRFSLLLPFRKQPADCVDSLGYKAIQVAKPEAPAPDSNCVDQKVNERPIANAESKEDAKVSPFLAGFDVQRCEKFRPCSIGTVSTVRRGGLVREISFSSFADESACVLGTCLAGWRVEASKL